MLLDKLQKKTDGGVLTDTVGTWMLAITFRSELVALITRSANSPADGASCPCCPCCWAIWVLSVLLLVSRPGQVGVVNANMLLELL